MKLTMVTLKDISRYVGCSVSLVSRALNKSYPYIKESTRKEILDTAERMGYYPNWAARSLTGQKTGVIGVLVAGISGIYYSDIVKGIEYVASQCDYSLIFPNSYRPSEYWKLLDRVDGLIIFNNYIKETNRILKLTCRDIPMVIVDAYVSDARINCVYTDNEYGGYIATKHLIDLKHTRIAHIAGDLENRGFLARLEGYKNALLEANLPLTPELIKIGSFNGDDCYLAMKELLEYRPSCTAVFVANDQMSFRALRAIREADLSVPKDISVIAYDDVEYSRYTNPPLTTIRQPRFAMGEQAMSRLVSILKKSQPGTKGVKTYLPPELIIRGTTDRCKMVIMPPQETVMLPASL